MRKREKIELIKQGGCLAIKRSTISWWLFRKVEYFDFKSLEFTAPPASFVDRVNRLWLDANLYDINLMSNGSFTFGKRERLR